MSIRLAGISLFAVLGLSAALIGNFVAHAAPSSLEIKEVFVEFDTHGIIITGENFDSVAPEDLVVTLGTLGDISDICVASDPQTITCDFAQPAFGTLPVDGDYVLTLDTAGGPSKPITFDLTIGAVGPVGPEGPAGADGAPGATTIYANTSGPLALGPTPQTQSSTCNDDDVPTGGGYSLVNGSGQPSTETSVVVESRPNEEGFGLGWAVTAFTATTNAIVNLYVAVICTDIELPPIPPLPS